MAAPSVPAPSAPDATVFPRSDEAPELNPDGDDLLFQVLDFHMPESDKAARKIPRDPPDPGSRPPPPPEYEIYMFGATAAGHSVCAKVTGFQPSFYVRPPTSWWKQMNTRTEELKGKLLFELIPKVFKGESYMGTVIPKRLRDHLVCMKPVKRKDFWGFTNGRDFPYIFVQTKSLALFNALKRYFGDVRFAAETKARAEAVRTGATYDRDEVDTFKMYESNIEPFLRFVHKRRISPSGWVRLPAGYYEPMEASAASGDDGGGGEEFTRAVINVQTDYTSVFPHECNQIAPVLIASWDIECTSSHGDFPIPQKTYQKLALNLIQSAKRHYAAHDETPPDAEQISEWIRAAFARPAREFVTPEGAVVHPVYPKRGYLSNTPASHERLAAFIATAAPKVSVLLGNAVRPKKPAAGAGAYGRTRDEDGGFGGGESGDEDAPSGPAKSAAVAASDLELAITSLLGKNLPPLQGDPIIQIGTTVHRYGSDDIVFRHICVLNSCDAVPNAVVETYDTEAELILGWRDMVQRLDPDFLVGYNVFGFDHDYLWKRSLELDIADELAVGFGRIRSRQTTLLDQRLSSSALGDNFLYYLDLDGIVQIDMLKVMQRDHKLDSFKLDHVAEVFLGDHKNDLKPREIFEKFQGTATDRAEIASYCLQDCALVNRLITKLKIMENTVGMSSVCSVPLSYLFMRGQGVKIFSLVSKECQERGYVIPTLRGFRDDETDLDPEADAGYEGAIVLPPKEGMYLSDPITVFDYASLYPSSMIERNLSHDCYVRDPQYLGLESQGITYITVTYDVYEGVGDKKRLHSVNPTQSCTFAQLPDGKKGIIPTILMKLLNARKTTRKKIEYQTLTLRDGSEVVGLIVGEPAAAAADPSAPGTSAGAGAEAVYTLLNVETGENVKILARDVVAQRETYNPFEQAVLDAMQLAYKVTANSLYGQVGARTSPIYLKDIAACTTATGRERILMAKAFMEKHYNAEIIYGDTDSLMIRFPNKNLESGERVRGYPALAMSIKTGQEAAKAIKPHLPAPQSLEYEKTFYPWILLSKKRYVGNLYEDDATKKPKQKSMGIVLKRRDNAQIVKQVYGGIIDILLNRMDVKASVDFFHSEMQALVNGTTPLTELIISKTLKGEYRDPLKIAHKVLADRMSARDPGNKPMPSDRIPFVYIQPPPGVDGATVRLQGDRIEHPDYIRENDLKPDYRFYITNQIMKPVCQLYALVVNDLPGYDYGPGYWAQMDEEMIGHRLYADDKKRKDRLTALKMKVVAELLFEPYLADLPDLYKPPKALRGSRANAQEFTMPADQLAVVAEAAREAANMPSGSGGAGGEVTPRSAAAKAARAALLVQNAYRLTLHVICQRSPKAYLVRAVLLAPPHDEPPVWTQHETIVPTRASMTKELAFRQLAEACLAEVHEQFAQVCDVGLVVAVTDAAILRLWRRALQSVVTLDDDIQAAMRDGDSERIKELNAILGYRNLVVALGSVPYVLETGEAPSESLFVAAPAPGAAPAMASPADGEDPAAASAPAPPPAKRTRARKT